MYKLPNLLHQGNRLRFFPFMLFILLGCFANAQIIWDGGGGNTNWDEPNNWDPDGLPTSLDDVSIPNSGYVDIPNGFTATAKSLSLTGNATLNIDNSGVLELDGSTSTYALSLNSSYINVFGSLQITDCLSGIGLLGASSSVTNTGSITVDNHNGFGAVIASGCTDCNIVTSSSMSFDHGTNASNPAVSFAASASSGNIIINSGTMSIGATSHAGIGIGLGSLGGYFLNTGTLNIINTGGVGVNSGFIPGTLSNSSTGTINFGAGIGGNWVGGFNLNLINEGNININKVSSVASVVVSGSGIFGGTSAFSTNNIVSPGSSGNAGCLLFNSGYSNTGSTNLQIGGTTQCAEFDVIFGSTSLTLAGTLNVSLINGFTPTAGQSFTLLNAASRVGTFTTVNYPSVPGVTWTTSYTGTSVIANAIALLPVELSHFTAKTTENNSIRLEWRTASELNNAGFQVERSTDAKAWEPIGFVEGNGSTATENSYFLEDKTPLNGTNYYRLRQLDFDGKAELSEVVGVDLPSAENTPLLVLSPNPTNGFFEIKSEVLTHGAELFITDNLGRIVKNQVLDGESLLDVQSLPRGIYQITIAVNKGVLVERLVKL